METTTCIVQETNQGIPQMLNRNIIVFVSLGFGSAFGLFCGCEGKIDSSSSVDAGADTTVQDGSSIESGSMGGHCVLTGDQCLGDSRCCPPVGAFRVDLERNCRAAVATPFYCDPPQGGPPSPGRKGCGCSDEITCAYRQLDAGMAQTDAAEAGGVEAGLEVFYSPCYLELPGLQRCEADLATRAQAASVAVCP